MKNEQNKVNTALAAQGSTFLALANLDFASMVSEELDGLDIAPEKIKIPSGGVTVFEIPSMESDEAESVKEFSGVILHQHSLNMYYNSKYTGGSNPPDCGSYDGATGVGEPGGNCKKCPLNQYGSGENGGKACQNRRRLYILREGELFPLLFSLPAGSLKPFTRYLKQLLSKGNKSNAVVTKFSLKKATNAGGVPYSQAAFVQDRVLTHDEYAVIEKLSEQIKTYSTNVGFEDDGAGMEEYIDHETGEIIQPLTGGNKGV